jgi:hypothetical protein
VLDRSGHFILQYINAAPAAEAAKIQYSRVWTTWSARTAVIFIARCVPFRVK